MKPLAIDLFCGLGGWTEGLLAEGYDVIGFDIERHEYGDAKYPAQMVIQDVLTLHGKQFKDAALIVASPPCQEFSYMAMPWSKAKAKERDLLEGRDDPKRLTRLFDACFRIQREACEAAGRHIPMVVENVRGAQKWVGRARWNFGSFYLWGDVPALMPIVKRAMKMPEGIAERSGTALVAALGNYDQLRSSIKNNGGSWFNIGSPGQKETGRNPVHELAGQKQFDEAIKGVGIGSRSWHQGKGQRHPNDPRNTWSKSSARKAASAMIAKIPLILSQHIARAWKPA